MPYPHPLVRLTALAAALLVAGGCTQGQRDSNDGAHPAPRVTVYPTRQEASFKVNPSTQDESPYTVIFQRGSLTGAEQNALSGTGNGVKLGSACRLQAHDVAIPFTLHVRWENTAAAKKINLSLQSYQTRPDGKRVSLPSRSVQIELARPGKTPTCDAETSVASTPISYQKSFAPESPTFSGWLILRGKGQSSKAGLTITSTVPYHRGFITDIRGFTPYKPHDSQKAFVSGGSTLFRSTISV